jgi:hypothetical protein
MESEKPTPCGQSKRSPRLVVQMFSSSQRNTRPISMVRTCPVSLLLLAILLALPSGCGRESQPTPTPLPSQTKDVSQGTQQVSLGIIYHLNGKHLKLKAELDKVSLKGDPVVWNVMVEHRGISNVRAENVILWFPEQLLGEGKREIPIAISYPTNDPEVGSGKSSPISLNRNFDLRGADPYIMPLAIFCDIDAGQGAIANGPFKQKGRQMVDGLHSHPQHLVGP